MMDDTEKTRQGNLGGGHAQSGKESMSFLLKDNPLLAELLLKPAHSENSRVNDTKVRRLYLQSSQQQWFAPQRINFEPPIELDEETRRVWVRFVMVFFTLEKMGLNVISNMMSKAVRRLKSDECSYYLSAQCFDEARHVFVLENYLKKLGSPPKYDYTYHVLGQAASVGFFRVENWLFSTLFSENFASVFLRRAKTAKIDPIGAEVCKYLQIDESRHLHFLHIVLPDIMDRMSLFGRGYVKMSQYFIMKFTEVVSRSLEADAHVVGLDRRALMEEVFENVERAYEGFGVPRRFLPFPTIKSTGSLKKTSIHRPATSH
jgi:hypothetical protein